MSKVRVKPKTASARKTSGVAAHERWHAVLSRIEENLSTNLSIAELAVTAGVSASCFARSFKKLTGLTPCNYVIRQRIEEAKRLVLKGELELAEIAAHVGFADQAHLTRYFKRLTGMTPAQFCRHSRMRTSVLNDDPEQAS